VKSGKQKGKEGNSSGLDFSHVTSVFPIPVVAERYLLPDTAGSWNCPKQRK